MQNMAFNFDGRRAVVAGGSRGIGRSIALGFARAGAGVSPRSPHMGAQRIRRPAAKHE
jgi:NAD(P)-dependent dehydrogenase (short-subunit alcohol dehydrogenase family)